MVTSLHTRPQEVCLNTGIRRWPTQPRLSFLTRRPDETGKEAQDRFEDSETGGQVQTAVKHSLSHGTENSGSNLFLQYPLLYFYNYLKGIMYFFLLQQCGRHYTAELLSRGVQHYCLAS